MDGVVLLTVDDSAGIWLYSFGFIWKVFQGISVMMPAASRKVASTQRKIQRGTAAAFIRCPG